MAQIHLVKLTILLVVCVAGPVPIVGWWDYGHMMTAAIADLKLTESARNEVQRLVTMYPGASDQNRQYPEAACYPDDIKKEAFNAFEEWHFTNVPYNPTNITIKGTEPINLEWALKQCVDTLSSSKATDFNKAFMIRFLIHLMGDLHQPLHCVSYFSDKYPEGDRGGNLFYLKDSWSDKGELTNLHKLWDSGIGQYEDIERPLSDASRAKMSSDAQKLVDEYGNRVTFGKTFDFDLWIDESHTIAVEDVYDGITEHENPTSSYIERGIDIVHHQFVAGGLRLADVLNALFDDSVKTADI